jgi:heptosyltransferase-2
MKLVLFLPNWVGDVVQATPALRGLRQHFPTAHLIGVARPYVAAVLEGAPWLDELWLWERGSGWALARHLRRQPPDWALLFPNSLRCALLAWWAGCRQRVGFCRWGRRWLLTQALAPVRGLDGRRAPYPLVLDYNRLAQATGCPDPGTRLELFTTPAEEAAADALWQQEGLTAYREVVCLNGGGAYGAAKHWPWEYFARLARRLAQERGCGVLLLAGPAERSAVQALVQAVAHPAVRSAAAGPLSLGLTKACVRRARLLITTDSGPRHFAAAFDRPVLTLFGPTHIAWTETFHPRAVHLQKTVSCGPCQRRRCPLDHACMTQLTPDEVFQAACRLLDQEARRQESSTVPTPALGQVA